MKLMKLEGISSPPYLKMHVTAGGIAGRTNQANGIASINRLAGRNQNF